MGVLADSFNAACQASMPHRIRMQVTEFFTDKDQHFQGFINLRMVFGLEQEVVMAITVSSLGCFGIDSICTSPQRGTISVANSYLTFRLFALLAFPNI